MTNERIDDVTRTVREISDSCTPDERASMMYHIIEAAYDSVKFTAAAILPTDRQLLGELPDAALDDYLGPTLRMWSGLMYSGAPGGVAQVEVRDPR